MSKECTLLSAAGLCQRNAHPWSRFHVSALFHRAPALLFHLLSFGSTTVSSQRTPNTASTPHTVSPHAGIVLLQGSVVAVTNWVIIVDNAHVYVLRTRAVAAIAYDWLENTWKKSVICSLRIIRGFSDYPQTTVICSLRLIRGF